MYDDTDLESKRQAAIAWLGERWLLHPIHAPKKGQPVNPYKKEV